ncbi:hypothetical protein DRJ19_04855 [Candidatus Woesearchaeota archaeon]|nr:MAG: hypothetical protein DRJ19_04855 [Candidatus Woesearchaeota archaeon]
MLIGKDKHKNQITVLICLILLSTFLLIIGCAKKQTAQLNETTEQNKPIPAQKSIPLSIENNCIGFLIGTMEEIPLVAKAGGAWIRPHPGPFSWELIEPKKGTFDFTLTDDLVKTAQYYNIAILPTIWPYASWDQAKCHGEECLVTEEDQFYSKDRIVIPNSRCKPCDWNAYKKFLSELVERYDGDGFKDMPGLQIPIKYWEILNEPEMREKDLTFFKGDEKEYVEILKYSYEAIKSSCPDCKVVQGGCAGNGKAGFWENVFTYGGADYFDIANIHFITHGDKETLNVKDFKALLDKHNIKKPIWVTEAELTDEKNLIEYSKNAIKAGATKIFFTKILMDDHKISPVYKNITDICNVP